MEKETDKIYATLAAREQDLINLRKGYAIVSERYSAALVSLKELTISATEAAKRAVIPASPA